MPGQHTFVIDVPESETNARMKRALVLIVDERPDICDLLHKALTLVGYRVTAVAGREGWLDDAMQSDDPPALVLLDLSDPFIDAVTFLRDLRARWKASPPLLVMTTSKHIYDELVTVERVVLKPFRVSQLLNAVQQITLCHTETKVEER